MWCRWFWKGQQAKYKLLFHIFPFTLLEKFSSCIASICNMTCTYFEAVFIEMSSKMTVATKLWTLWSQVQYRFKRSTLALIVRHISRDAENQRYWSDLRFIERFLTKIVWHWGCRHCKALAGNVLGDIWLFNQIWVMMNKHNEETYLISASSDEKIRTVHKDAKSPLHPTVLNSASQRLAIVREQSEACIETASSAVLP